jgi:hypothetical protein
MSPRRGRRRSLDDGAGSELEDVEEEEEREVAVRDKQLRGYGIGGVGNISEWMQLSHWWLAWELSELTTIPGRPTEVIYGPTRRQGAPADKLWWTLRDMFGRGDRKGKTPER